MRKRDLSLVTFGASAQEHENALRLLMENVRDYAIFTLDIQRIVTSWNVGAERISGYSEKEILGQSGDLLFTPEDRAQDAPGQEMHSALTTGRAEDERWHVRKDGTRFWGTGILTALYDEGDKVRGFAKILRDMTARKQAEEQQKKMTALLVEQERYFAILEERNRIAQEIHDTLAQGFVGIALHLDTAESILVERNDEDLDTVRNYIAQARLAARDSIREARRSINALRPQELEGNSLPEALQRLVLRITADVAMQSEFRLQGIPYSLLTVIEDSLFRIGQEAVTNVFKHARARQMEMELRYRTKQVELCICDNGRGFNVEKAMSEDGQGLKGMRQRAERIGGYLHISSQPGRGTEILATINRAESPTMEEAK